MVRTLNGNEPPWSRNEHLIADLWAWWAKQDHPARVEMEAKAHRTQKLARVIELKARFENRKRAYGLE